MPNLQVSSALSGTGQYVSDGSSNSKLSLSTGNVGIGTTNPGELFTVQAYNSIIAVRDENGTLAARMLVNPSDDDGRLQIYDGGSVKVDLKADGDSYLTGGKVGLGTTAPEGLLHGATTSNTFLRLDTYTSSNFRPVLQFVRSTGSLGVKSQTSLGNDLGYIEFYGVNTGSNWAKAATIEVSQSGGAGASFVPARVVVKVSNGSSSPVAALWVNSDGNVGIGTNLPTPSQKLEVDGNIKASGHVMLGNVRFGAGWSLPSTSDATWQYRGSLFIRTSDGKLHINTASDGSTITWTVVGSQS